MPIQSTRDAHVAALLAGQGPGKGFLADLVSVTRRRLRILADATSLDDLRAVRGNRLHALTDDREGQYAISVNDQFRLCFRWTEDGAADVEFVDYH